MKRNFKCGVCYGSGQSREWSDDGKKIVLQDCKFCKGTGVKVIEVKDNRFISKSKELDLPNSA